MTYSLPLGIVKEECFAKTVKKGVPACSMWVKGSSHPSGAAMTVGREGTDREGRGGVRSWGNSVLKS